MIIYKEMILNGRYETGKEILVKDAIHPIHFPKLVFIN